MKPKILVVDDEPDAVELIEFNLAKAGYRISTAVDGAQALRKARSFEPDLILLDLMLPELDGLEVCKLLRKDPKTAATPIIMVTARAGELDRILGLELGANDYLTKPFSPRELVLRIGKQLQPTAEPPTPLLHCRAIELDPARHRVTVSRREIELTAIEFKLLHTLMLRQGRVQTRERLLKDVWEYESGVDSRTVDTHIRRLRGKLGCAAACLSTLRGVGYRLSP